jgi:uncharacterized protein YjbI with pentapeptide repeats
MNKRKTELIELIRADGTAGLEKWKSNHPELSTASPCPIDLKDAKLCGVNLNGADLTHADLSGAFLKAATFVSANLSGADLTGAHLEGAFFNLATLRGTHLRSAHLENAVFCDGNLSGAHLNHAYLDKADFSNAVLTEADLSYTRCEGEGKTNFTRAVLCYAKLEKSVLPKASFEHAILKNVKAEGAIWNEANLSCCDLSAAELKSVDLRDVSAQYAIVDGATLIDAGCDIGRGTDFSGTGLQGIRIPPELLSELEYNIRRVNWQRYYKRHPFMGFLWWLFWITSDYGKSTGRIVFTFLLFSVVFAVLYLMPTPSPSWLPDWLPRFHCETIVANLDSYKSDVGKEEPIQHEMLWLRSFYFSIVTMTTLGFGDMHAYPNGYLGHILITLQVLIGYILLGALITRLSILFQSKCAI